MPDAFDHIVTGAGSAGCVLANRLSANPAHPAPLLEAGPAGKSMGTPIPAGVMKVLRDTFVNWPYFSEPEAGLKGKKVYWPSETTLGGCRAVNGIACMRDAQAEDFVRTSGNTMFHPVGTCLMGAGGDAAVDSRLRVRGVAGRRVADCSILRTIVSGNTNAPAMMIGQKTAEMVVSDARA